MHVCVVQAYGLGNAVLCTPMIRGLLAAGHQVDVLVEPNRAARFVFEAWPSIRLHQGHANGILYDHTIFCHSSRYHLARLKTRTWEEPTLAPASAGRDQMWAWTRHEVEVLMDFAYKHGYQGPIPRLYVPEPVEPPSFPGIPQPWVALGIGHLKTNFWRGKHWGNGNYGLLCRELIALGLQPVILGDIEDIPNAMEIRRACPQAIPLCGVLPFPTLMGLLKQTFAFIGNDSGLMHCAAAFNRPTIGIFLVSNPVKNRPWTDRGVALEHPSISEVLAALDRLTGYNRKERTDERRAIRAAV